MANIIEQLQWETGIYQYANGDALNGGPDTSEVLPIKQLGNRTKFLRTYSVNPWQAALAPYPAEAYASESGKTWRSLVTNNMVQPGTDPTKWEQWGFTLSEMRKGIMSVQETRAYNVEAGAAISGVNVRNLNTVVSNTILGASLLNNQITLPIGRYKIKASAPAFNVNRHQIALFNVTSNNTVAFGTLENTTDINSVQAAENPVQTKSELFAVVTLNAPAVFLLRHFTEIALANGLGPASPFSGNLNVFSTVEIEELF